jgi:hypothetical protein
MSCLVAYYIYESASCRGLGIFIPKMFQNGLFAGATIINSVVVIINIKPSPFVLATLWKWQAVRAKINERQWLANRIENIYHRRACY